MLKSPTKCATEPYLLNTIHHSVGGLMKRLVILLLQDSYDHVA